MVGGNLNIPTSKKYLPNGIGKLRNRDLQDNQFAGVYFFS